MSTGLVEAALAASMRFCGPSGDRAEGDPALPILFETGYRELVGHLSESTLEEYALGRLSRYRTERVEACDEGGYFRLIPP